MARMLLEATKQQGKPFHLRNLGSLNTTNSPAMTAAGNPQSQRLFEQSLLGT